MYVMKSRPPTHRSPRIPVAVNRNTVQSLVASVASYNKTHVRGFFATDLHEVSWHFATHEAVRPRGF